jgi:hypothetical protein
MAEPSPAEIARFAAGAYRYAAEAFRHSPHEAQRKFAPTLDTWAANAERRAEPDQGDLFTPNGGRNA